MQTAFTINLGYQSDATHLVLYVGRFPREVNYLPADLSAMTNLPEVSDLRRISYWLVGGTDSPRGLARQELKVATPYGDLATLPFDGSDEDSYIIAPEVKDLHFSYFDGNNCWQ